MTAEQDPGSPEAMPPPERNPIALQTTRMEAFSDGVFAIAITLLVLEIKVPVDRGSDLLHALIEQWPSYLAYFISFCTIGAVWMAHSAITDLLDRVDALLLRINLLLLLLVGLLPIPTALAAEYLKSTDGERVAVTIYGLTLLAIRLVVLLLWKYASAEGLVRTDLDDAALDEVTAKLTPSLGLYVVAIAVGLAAPSIAVVLYLAIALYIIIPLRSILSAFRRTAP